MRRLGEESRDDSHGVGQSSEDNPSTPPPGSFRPILAQHEQSNDYGYEDEEDEDEIPCLIDEDQVRYSSPFDTPVDDNDDDHRFPTQQSTFSTPKPPHSKPSSKPAPASAPAATNQSNDAVPFFVLDWMIEDLVPAHQNAQDLAILLQEQAFKTSYRKSSPIRKAKSANTVVGHHNQRSSPLFQRILPWNKTQETNPPEPIQQSDRPTTPPPSKDSNIEPCPETPKSSNRKSSKLRQKHRNTFMHDGDGECDAAHEEFSMPMVPRDLNGSLEECETRASSSVANDSISKFTARVSSDTAPEEPLNTSALASSATTKKSSSCPQLYQQEETEAQQLRQRAKEQHDRRERRNKLTVFQRSLSLAQGWNNKGLTMAGNATRAEQQRQQQPQAKEYWDSALECWGNALEIYRSLLGESHERVADVQNNRGIALGKLGQFDKAFEALGTALKARKKQYEWCSGESCNACNDTESPSASAIVSTLHNIANVFRDAGNPCEALRVLVEAQQTLNVHSSTTLYQKHHSWHQSARLSTAIGHVYYESNAWREARSAYGEALTTYNQLQRSLLNYSESLTNAKEDKHVVQHRELIEQEVAVLEKDLDELDRSQQAKDGSRARLLQVRKQQQQKQQQPRKPIQPPRPNVQQSLLGIVSSLRA